MMDWEDREGHVGTVELAAYLDGNLPHDARARVEGHLADCDACRGEVVEAARVLRSRRRRRRWYIGAPAAAAAAVAAVLFLLPSAGDAPRGREPALRGADERALGEGSLGIVTSAPENGQIVDPASLIFAWQVAAPEALYRITLSDATGEVLWSEVISDTAIALPSAIGLQARTGYFWYVDALLPDGRSATTGVRRFGTGP